MTLDELKKEYEVKADKLYNEGLEASKRAERYEGYANLYSLEDEGHKTSLAMAMSEAKKAEELFKTATIYVKVVNDLLKVTK